MKMSAWSKLVPVVIFAAMLASACATHTDSGQGGGGSMSPYGSGSSAPRQGGSAGSMSGGGSMSSGSMP